ncbi:MAG: hypothetical protein AB1736_01180 [Chloroflexota bacterium]
MTTRDDFDRRLHTWLSGHEWDREPELLLEEVLARTARTSRRPAWLIPERWLPMSAITSRFAPSMPVPWRAVGLVALLLLALIAGALILAGSQPFRPAPPFGPAANGALAFSRAGDVFVVDGLGGTPRKVLGGPNVDAAPLFSPDGSHMLVLRDLGNGRQALVWAGFNGADPRIILDDIDAIGWAEIGPGGDVVAVQIDSEPGVLRIVATDGSGSTSIETGLDVVRNPIFRPPAGDQLTFEGWGQAGERGIYLVNLDGTGLIRLELDPGYQADEFYALNRDYYFQAPSWAASGSRLAYPTLEPDPVSPAGPGFRVHIAEVGPSGDVTSEEILEFDPAMDDEFAPTWLPTGNVIVYHSVEGTLQRMWLADLDAGRERGTWASPPTTTSASGSLPTAPRSSPSCPSPARTSPLCR